MISDWEAAISFVLEMEGGYTDDPKDPGGETKFGISKRSYHGIDIANLTLEAAKEIYERDFWKSCGCDELPTPYAIALFDTAVNQGAHAAIKMLQKSFGVNTDGIMGPITIAAAWNAKPRAIKLFLAERLSAYMKTIADNPDLMVFSTNWSFRVVSLAELILK